MNADDEFEIHREPVDATRYGAAALADALAAGIDDRLGRLVGMAVLAQADERFFDALVQFLSTTFRADMVIVAAVDDPDDPREARTLAAFENGERVANFPYALAGTPCDNVVHEPTMCLFRRGTADRFPEDHMLTDYGIEGYCGIPLLDAKGRMLGLLAVLTRAPIEQPEALSAMLRVYGSRASLELEHLLALEAGRADPEYRRVREERDHELIDALEALRGV